VRAPDFWRRDGASIWPLLLAPAAAAWGIGAWLRPRLARPIRLGVPVISVGNLVAGGAGKTPTVLALAQWLLARGLHPQLVSRGHGGSEAGPLRVDPACHDAAQAGDEALLLAEAAPTWIARDRMAAARAAVAAGAELLILDDGHQDPRLVKDLALVVVDGDYGMGNGRLIPAGPLREPAEAGLSRADAVVAIGAPAASIGGIAGFAGPVLEARLAPDDDALGLAGKSVLAFAGIGRPEKFFRTLRDLGAKIAGERAFADHHRYAPEEIMALVESAARSKAVLVTTAKDWARLPPEARPMVTAVRVRLEFADPQALEGAMAGVMEAANRPSAGAATSTGRGAGGPRTRPRR
jgi:tetraacyldisaccharide 4'-kinase